MYNLELKKMSMLLDGLIVFHELNADRVIHSFQSLLRTMDSEELNMKEIFRKYHHFCALAIETKWPDYLWMCVLRSDNELTHHVALADRKGIARPLKEYVTHDLLIIREISQLTPVQIKQWIGERLAQEEKDSSRVWFDSSLSLESWPVWTLEDLSQGDLQTSSANHLFSRAENYLLKAQGRVLLALKEGTPEEMVDELIVFYQTIGTGILSDSLGFKWQGLEGQLKGVRPDPIGKEQLIGQEREQGIVLENTEFFLAGYPANNIILYGNRGTGKSSLVKALLQEYFDRGLRLVELSKNDLADFPKVMQCLKDQPQKFILFIDDLSFEESEAEFKALKTLLEGGLEGKPKNVLIYATSNRRHLVRENFSERLGDEVNRRDNMEEKLSLSDRFGITVTFLSPDQEGFLKIVEELANQEEITIDREQLRQQALRWVMMHNARSGRTARQFIDYLVASQGIAAK